MSAKAAEAVGLAAVTVVAGVREVTALEPVLAEGRRRRANWRREVPLLELLLELVTELLLLATP